MKYKITFPTKKELDLLESVISITIPKPDKIVCTFFYKNQRPFGWITKNAIGKIIDAEPIKEPNPLVGVKEDEKHWFLRCDSKTETTGEFPEIINKIFLKKIDNLLKNE